MDRLYDAFESAGYQLFLVGGAVRDIVLGQPLEGLADLDYATDATPDESLAVLREAGIHTHEVGKRFGTVGAVLRGPRSEGYPKSVQVTTYRPTVQAESNGADRGESLEADLSRRDFAINAMAMGRDRVLIDPIEGQADIAAKRIRAVGDPTRMLRDDPLRLLRLARFVATLGFEVDPALLAASAERAPSILDASRERWLQEMNKLLAGPHADLGLEVLRKTRVLAMVLPEVQALIGFHESCPVHHKDIWAHTLGVLGQTAAEPVLRWTALVHDAGKAWTRSVEGETVRFIGHEALGAVLFEGIAERFKMDRKSAARIRFLIAEHGTAEAYTSEWSNSAVRRLVGRAGEHLQDLLAFARADLTTRFDDKRAAAHQRLDELHSRIEMLAAADSLEPHLPPGLGRAIITELDVAEGPEVGAAVDLVKDAVLDGRLPGSPSVSECLELLSDEEPFRAEVVDDEDDDSED